MLARLEASRGNVIEICGPVFWPNFISVSKTAKRAIGPFLICEDHTPRCESGRSPTWRQWNMISTQMRRQGRPMQQIDRLIAAIAVSLGNCTVVSSDSDLAAIPGLNVENWTKS
ncbi:MAG TPA: hypothetical protein VGL71_06035 [Urbifossiella sp.]